MQPGIDAIEIDGSQNFFAGSGPNGATVRLYVNDKFVGDAIVAGGRWLVDASKVLTQHTQTVRVDVLKPGSSDVASARRSEFRHRCAGAGSGSGFRRAASRRGQRRGAELAGPCRIDAAGSRGGGGTEQRQRRLLQPLPPPWPVLRPLPL